MRGPRVPRHLQAVGILWLVFGGFRVLGGLASMFFLSAVTSHRMAGFGIPFPGQGPGPVPPWMVFIGPAIATTTVVSAVLAFAAAFGLLSRASWGRIVGLIAAVLALFSFPFGTALGIYTLWVLAPTASGVEYERMAVRGGA